MTESGRKGIGSVISRALSAVIVTSCLIVTGNAQAVTVSGLYSADVAVENSSEEALQAGYREGLRQVMVRVSGSREVLSLEGVEGVLENAEPLLQSYELTRDQDQDRLQMTFGAVGVNKALASIDAPVWGANRPLTLAWIAVQDGGGRYLITTPAQTDVAAGWRDNVVAAAAGRGLPLAFPERSFAGNRGILSDLWGQFDERIVEASEGQNRDSLALVRIRRSGGEWRADWTFEGAAMDSPERSVSAATPWALAQALVNQWSEAFASRYAVAASDVGESPKVDIVLEGVSTLADYGGVANALEGFSPVHSVEASRVRGDRLTVQVAFSGELDQLKQYVALDPRFVAMEQPRQTALPEEPGTQEKRSSEQSSSAGNTPSPVAYQPLNTGDEKDAEQAFESLYQVLYYRWQPTSIVGSDSDG
ncbi:DUF2066 domain-containing protein [Marinobacter nauticus]